MTTPNQRKMSSATSGQTGFIAAIITTVAAAIPQLANFIGENFQRHRRILRDLELLEALPPESAQHRNLQTWIDSQIADYIYSGSEHKRNLPGFYSGLVTLLPGLYFGWVIKEQGGWWWIASPIALLAILLGIIAITQGLQKAKRDERGRIVKAEKQ